MWDEFFFQNAQRLAAETHAAQASHAAHATHAVQPVQVIFHDILVFKTN